LWRRSKAAIKGIEIFLDYAKWEILIALGKKYVTKTLEVVARKFTITGRCALWLDEAFGFEEANLRDSDIREITTQLR
jgi:hypothetical protein